MPPKKRASPTEATQLEATSRPKRSKQNEPEDVFGLQWKDIDNYYWVLTSPEIKPSAKCAAFDLDHTLIKPKSKGKFPANRSDWVWLLDEVKPKLQELHNDGYTIVIFTNQGGIEKMKQNLSDIQGKIIDMCKDLGFPLQAFVAGAVDHYRKPHTTMWDDFVSNYNGGISIDMDNSFYCGDAAGRPKNWKAGAPRDFSCTDRKFAANIGLKFYTPEELFLNEQPYPDFDWDSIDPVKTLKEYENAKFDDSKIVGKGQEVVVLVACPASGKSTLSKRYFIPAGYEIVNRDTLGTAAKCKQAMENALKNGKSVVIDNTNPSVKARGEFVAIAKAHNVPVRCIWLDTPREIAEHQNYVREKMTNGAVRRVPDVGFNTFFKNFQEPTTDEGFTEVVHVKWAPVFDSEDAKKLFLKWTG